MIERFHCSLKSALQPRLAGSDWFFHLPLVLLGLRTIPKDNTELSVSEAVYGSSLTVPGEFLGSPELPPALFLRKIEDAIAGFCMAEVRFCMAETHGGWSSLPRCTGRTLHYSTT